MKTRKPKTLSTDNSQPVRKRPLGQRAAGIFFCICLLMASLPLEYLSLPVLAAPEQEQQEILSFAALPVSTRLQNVPVETPAENLNLPDTLTAEVRLFTAEAPGETQQLPETPTAPEHAGAETKGTDTSAQPPTEGTAAPAGLPEDTDSSDNAQVPEASDASQTTETGTADTPTAPEAGTEEISTEMITLEYITWKSTPAYDSQTDGTYVFRPVLPTGYRLAEGVELPEISVTAEGQMKKGHSQETSNTDGKKSSSSTTDNITSEPVKVYKPEDAKISELFRSDSMQTPACGTISTDTTWSYGTLSSGELIVKPGVTLTINGTITLEGKVTIKGGGRIVRGHADAYFSVGPGADLTVGDITLEGNSVTSRYSLFEVYYGKITLDDGCRIQNCIQNAPQNRVSAAVFVMYGTAVFNDATIENCSTTCLALYGGGAVWAIYSTMTINGGVYKNNKRISQGKGCGGFLVNTGSKLYIYGGSFIGNTSDAIGGCIYHSGAENTETYLYGGYFEGNTCTEPGYEGSGAIQYNGYGEGDMQKNIFSLSGNVQFCGDGTTSGMDGIYLDMYEDTSRKVQISNTLSYPITLYVKASEGYVIAEGTNDHILLHERDMKKINFVDVSGSGKQWYAVLDEEKNQVYLSETDPGYGYYVYYISNGAEGTVTDDNRYAAGDTATVKGTEGKLTREGYTFTGWNTKADGSGTFYHAGDTMEITGDVDLYAIFERNGGKTLMADFYSGKANQKETRTVTVYEDESGTITAPKPLEMEGFTPLGWTSDINGYEDTIPADSELTLTANAAYYGIYEKKRHPVLRCQRRRQYPGRRDKALPCQRPSGNHLPGSILYPCRSACPSRLPVCRMEHK